MAKKKFNGDDYVYLKINRDFEIVDGNWDTIKYKRGQILRFKRSWLMDKIMSRQFDYVFGDDGLDCVENPQTDENDILCHKRYQSMTLTKDISYEMCLWPGELLCFNEWLESHLDPKGFRRIISSSKKVITDGETRNTMIEISDRNVHARINFKAGEILDFTDPSVIVLFYHRDWLNFFASSKLVIGDERKQLFDEDFSNAIYAQDEISFSVCRNEPDYGLREYHYFIINPDIEMRDKIELLHMQSNTIDCNRIYYGADFIKDEAGYLRIAYTCTHCEDSSSREVEQGLLQWSRRATKEEATRIHEKRIMEYLKCSDERAEQMRTEMAEETRLLREAYENNKNNPELFPGVHGKFSHVLDDKVKENKKTKYTLQQIKEFYQSLKKLNSEVVKEMCFYGGTIPYILTNAEESREFGDVDIFIPVSIMERLREELFHQKSFEMIYDSRPWAESCQLTSRIQKESKELKTKKDETNNILEFMGLLDSMMDYDSNEKTLHINEDGSVTQNPFETFLASRRDYYNKIQDFGFKAKLFGVNISVFPMYQFGKDIMAKSFNVNTLYQFLLGVRVMNNAQMDDFVKNVHIYGSAVKILPLEYTLVSKESAVGANYVNRLLHDVADIEYIMKHREELGVTDERLEWVKTNYPESSVSIAYLINNGQVKTMGGESYKEYVLMNKGSRSFS